MGKQWKKDGKIESAARKGAIISKIAKEISVATRLGGSDPDTNPRLRLALRAGKENSVSKETVERAIKKGTGELEGADIEEIHYEGFGPHRVAVIIECQSDNRNRTASEIKLIFKKHDGQMGEIGSVAWMFDRVGHVSGKLSKANFDAEEEAIEVGANEVVQNQEEYSFYSNPEDLAQMTKALGDRGWDIDTSELGFKPKNFTELTNEQRAEVDEFFEALEDNEDTSKIFTTLKDR